MELVPLTQSPIIVPPAKPRPLPRWRGAAVQLRTGSLAELADGLPGFRQRSLPLTVDDGSRLPAGGPRLSGGGSPFSARAAPPSRADGPARFRNVRRAAASQRLDVIVREPMPDGAARVPAGAAAREQRLVQHADVAGVLRAALAANGIRDHEAEGELRLAEYGARMTLSLLLPDRFAFDPGDGHPLALRLLCVNTMERRGGVRFLLTWHRFASGAGLAVGTTQLKCHYAHRQSPLAEELGGVLARGLALAQEEQAALREWMLTPVPREALAAWVDGPVRRAWGVKAAARAWHLCQRGYDAELVQPVDEALPSQRELRPTTPVPGSPPVAGNAYHVSQALAWLAKERREVEETLDWMSGIPGLMRVLLIAARAGRG
ncbi:MAG: hypothetical protein ACOZDY_00850 [Pseudomonadota bacterium]